MTTEAAALPVDRLPSSASRSAAAAATATTSSTTPATTSAGASQTLGATDFLSLLTTELKNQDPLNPVDSTQSVAQLAQFSALQATTTLATNFSNFESNFAVSQASGLLGQTVTVTTAADSTGTSSTVSGVVKAIQVVNGSPQFTMVDSSGNPIAGANGAPTQFTTNQITGISK
jgi:flagellar basal-body rod modification protein FlgD